MSDTPVSSRLSGRVKWFNAKAGYGFATNLETGVDVFVHHTGLKVEKEQFRYLVEGEYIEMEINERDGKLTGTKLTGIKGGKLMCETRAESNQSNEHTSTRHSTRERKEEKKTVIQQLKYKPKTEI